MKIKTKDFIMEEKSENFIAIKRTMFANYDMALILELCEEMKSKGYELICETEFSYIFKNDKNKKCNKV